MRIQQVTRSHSTIDLQPARSAEVTRFVADISRMKAILGLAPDPDPLCHLEELLDSSTRDPEASRVPVRAPVISSQMLADRGSTRQSGAGKLAPHPAGSWASKNRAACSNGKLVMSVSAAESHSTFVGIPCSSELGDENRLPVAGHVAVPLPEVLMERPVVAVVRNLPLRVVVDRDANNIDVVGSRPV